MDAETRANREFHAESQKQLAMIYPAVVHVLWHDFGWRKLRIIRLLALTQEIWLECAAEGIHKSMLTMLEEETGIEMRNTEKKSFHEYSYLDESVWDKKKPTLMQFVYMRKQQAQWLPQIYLAAFGIALHRKYKWGYIRLARFIEAVQRIRFDCGSKTKNYRGLLDETDISIDDLLNYVRDNNEVQSA